MTNIKFLQVAFLSTLLLVLSHLHGFAQSGEALPALSGRVVDNASMLTATAAEKLESDLLAHEKKSGHQFVVATILSLRGEVLEDFSIRLARKWGLGSKERDNGVLLLVAKNDRKIRIEVGYGLEGTLTDALSSIIIRETITPAFRSEDFENGILRGAAQIMEVLSTGEMAPAVWQQERQEDRGSDWVPIVFVAIWLLFFFSSFISGWLVRRFGRQIKPGHYRWLGMDAGAKRAETQTLVLWRPAQQQRWRLVRWGRRVWRQWRRFQWRRRWLWRRRLFGRLVMVNTAKNISSTDHERITASIREAETRTSGEIFAVIAGQSDDYFFVAGFFAGFWSLLFGFLLAVAAPWLGFSPGVLTLASAQAASFATALILLRLAPRLRMLLVPRSISYRRASSNAVRQFLAHGVHATADRAGILIFVSLAERYAEVVADSSINQKVPQEAWDEMVATLTRHSAAGDPGEGFVLAVEQAAVLLAEHFPPVDGQENELDDRLIEL